MLRSVTVLCKCYSDVKCCSAAQCYSVVKCYSAVKCCSAAQCYSVVKCYSVTVLRSILVPLTVDLSPILAVS